MISYEYTSDQKFYLKKTEGLKKKFPNFKNALLRLPFTKFPLAAVTPKKPILFPRKIKKIFVIGMGGSSLGAKVLCELFAGPVSVAFIDNVEPFTVKLHLSRGDSKCGYLIASKSGETIEVLSLAKILFSKKIPRENFLVFTDAPKSALAKLAKKKTIKVIIGENYAPGRFSVFSKSGFLPLLLTEPSNGLASLHHLLTGAKNTSWEKAFTLATSQYLHAKDGKNIVVLFSYCERMSVFIDWYIQLLSESIGKSKTVGITPVKAIGVKDQHAQLQLFLDGPRDKFFIFLKEDLRYGDLPIPGEKYTLSELFNAEYEGVIKAFRKKEIPFVEIRFPLLSPKVVGELLFFFELQVAFLGLLFGINFENQPAVELSKQYTKRLLK